MWFIYALATSLCSAIYYICNQRSSLSPKIFIIYRGFIPALAVLPLALFMPADFAWPFFSIAFLQGLAVSYLDYSIYKLFQRYGAEAVSSIQPLSVLITFVFWLILCPSLLTKYMENIGNFTLIIVSISSIIFAVIKYRQQSFVSSCLREMAPLLVIFSFIDISNKIIMEYANNHLLAATCYRVLIVSATIGFINLIAGHKQHMIIKQLLNIKNIMAAWFITLIPISMILVNFSVFYAVNPAYTSAIIYLSVIWILLFSKISQYFGFSTNNKPIAKKWIVLLVISTMTLIIATSK